MGLAALAMYFLFISEFKQQGEFEIGDGFHRMQTILGKSKRITGFDVVFNSFIGNDAFPVENQQQGFPRRFVGSELSALLIAITASCDFAFSIKVRFTIFPSW